MMTEGYMSMKRKELEDFTDNFSDFSLCSPARKIRRLDAELAPIMEEDDLGIQGQSLFPIMQEKQQQSPVMEELPEENANTNEERAIVLFKPFLSHLLHSPNISISVNPDIISGFKNQFLWSDQSEERSKTVEEATNKTTKDSNCKAVVPWISSPFPPKGIDVFPEEVPELMDAEEMGEAAMVIEDNNSEAMNQAHELGGTRGSDSLGQHQWHQQHCMIPQLPQNSSTPITWLQ